MRKLKYNRKSKLDIYVDRIGIIPDREVAELAGVTSENVRAFRNRRNIPARWRGEGESAQVEVVVAAEPEIKKPKGVRGRKRKVVDVAEAVAVLAAPAPVVVPVVVSPVAAPVPVVVAAPVVVSAPVVAKAEPVMSIRFAQGYSVTVQVNDVQEEYVVVGSDIAQAAGRALAGLAGRGLKGQIVGIRFLAEALVG